MSESYELPALAGHQDAPVRIGAARAPPTAAQSWRRAYSTTLTIGLQSRFDAEQNAVVFAIDWLRRPVSGADAELLRLFKAQVDALELAHGSDFQEQVRAVLRSLQVAGHISAGRVAEFRPMHTRTLGRRLNTCDTSVQPRIDEGCFEIARQMLMDTDMKIQQIAVTLKYADASAFTRVFRRWSGMMPSRWRAGRERSNQAGRNAGRVSCALRKLAGEIRLSTYV